jgi:hypothetical protein
MQKRKYLAELTELRAIFQDCLPIGEHTEQAFEYFNSLEKVIFNHDFAANPNPIGREEFPDSEPDVQYTYLSDALFKERSSGPELRAHRQDMDYQPDVYPWQVPQLGREVSTDLASIREREGGRDLEYGEEDCYNSGW